MAGGAGLSETHRRGKSCSTWSTAEDRVIRQERRSVVHAQGLLHRAVHIFVFNSRGQLLVQRRSASKDEFPLTYTSSASGHVGAGETYDACAPRELTEEIGLDRRSSSWSSFRRAPRPRMSTRPSIAR